LGEFDEANVAKEVLDRFCRNDTLVIDKQDLSIVPVKDRCGSDDVVTISDDSKCYCQSKDKVGAKEGFWMSMEVMNIPFKDNFDRTRTDSSWSPNGITDKVVLDAVYIIEKALDNMFLSDAFFLNNGYVRSRVRYLEQGTTNLEIFRLAKIAQSNNTNATDIQEVTFLGDPILDPFEPTQEELNAIAQAKLDAELSGVTYVPPPPPYSTMVYFEAQFVNQSFLAGLFRQKMLGLLESGMWNAPEDKPLDAWASRTLWLGMNCFDTFVCDASRVSTCKTTDLDSIFSFGFSHSNVPDDDDSSDPDDVPLGGTLNLFCAAPGLRITVDKWDDDKEDYLLTVPCKLDGSFGLPDDDFPECWSWCPAEKPLPPYSSGLLLSEEHDNDREYWQFENISYYCNDSSLGVNHSPTQTELVRACLPSEPYGYYNVPRVDLNETWPSCKEVRYPTAERKPKSIKG